MSLHHTAAPYLEVLDLVKTFGKFTALDRVSFEARRGEFLSILGPSGCGKTTVLRAVAGLAPQDAGTIFIEGSDVSRLPISKRNVGLVFQSYALFPNLTAEDNIAFGLRNRRREKLDVKRRVMELLSLVGLSGLGKKYPAQLSGGQQQRVALARAMAPSPSLLLLDEPLSALDAKVRVKLRTEIRELQRELGVTTIMVTHDQEEALTMADRILVMNQGTLAQFGPPRQIYDWPNSPFVASFIGSMNFLPGAVKMERESYQVGRSRLRVTHEANGLKTGSRALVAIRPEDVAFLNGSAPGENVMPATINWVEFRGAMFRIGLKVKDVGAAVELEADLAADLARGLGLERGGKVDIHLPAERLRVYPVPVN
ncbi:MAG: putative 2-aminoethylphosphonate ABC transporter ATP-binding protein [Pseudomonadota bacterium]